MNIIQQLVDETEEFNWRLLMHKAMIDGMKSGASLIKANQNPYLNYLKLSSPEKFKSTVSSTHKSSSPYTPGTQGTTEARLFLDDGVLVLRYLILSKVKKMELHVDTPIEFVTRTGSTPVDIIFWGEMTGLRFDKYGWRIDIAGSLYSTSRTIEEYDACVLMQLGLPASSSGKRATMKEFKRIMETNK